MQLPRSGINRYRVTEYIADMTAMELHAVSVFNTAISEQDLDLLSELRTIPLSPATFRRLMLNAKLQGMNRTEGLRYAIELGTLAQGHDLQSW